MTLNKALLATAAIASILTPSLASAQSWNEVRRDRQEVRQDRAEVRADVRRGDYREAREDRREVREDRRETREDWRDWRDTHRDQYRRSAYVAPRGYRYAPVRAGVRIAPQFYGRSYLVSDYGAYRLPRPGTAQQYVRYGNDLLLVNVRSGVVLRVYDRFFW